MIGPLSRKTFVCVLSPGVRPGHSWLGGDRALAPSMQAGPSSSSAPGSPRSSRETLGGGARPPRRPKQNRITINLKNAKNAADPAKKY